MHLADERSVIATERLYSREERTGDGDALHLPSGKLVGARIAFCGQPHRFEQLGAEEVSQDELCVVHAAAALLLLEKRGRVANDPLDAEVEARIAFANGPYRHDSYSVTSMSEMTEVSWVIAVAYALAWVRFVWPHQFSKMRAKPGGGWKSASGMVSRVRSRVTLVVPRVRSREVAGEVMRVTGDLTGEVAGEVTRSQTPDPPDAPAAPAGPRATSPLGALALLLNSR